jgi:hypothetical protein
MIFSEVAAMNFTAFYSAYKAPFETTLTFIACKSKSVPVHFRNLVWCFEVDLGL